MDSDRIKWNTRFASEETFLGLTPSPFLRQHIGWMKQLAPGLRALDIACGEGRNSIFLAQNGFQVTGLDISDVGIGKARRRAAEAGVVVDFRQTDLDGYRLEEDYDLIVNFNFLLRELIPEAYGRLAPGGIFVLDSIMESPELLARYNPDYLLRKGELARLFGGLNGEILFIEEVQTGEMPTARILFRKGEA